MSDLQSRLAEWADRTVDMYNEIGKVYYNQSPLIGVNESPKILICGINPGSKGDFSELKGKDLLKGNKCWHTHHTWGFGKNLRQFFSFDYSLLLLMKIDLC